MEVTSMTRFSASEPHGLNLGSTSDGSFQDAIDRASDGYEKTEVAETATEYTGAMVPTALVVTQVALSDRTLVKLGPAAVAAGGAPDTVLRAVGETGERVMSALRSASVALSVEDFITVPTVQADVTPSTTPSTGPSPAAATAANSNDNAVDSVVGSLPLGTQESSLLEVGSGSSLTPSEELPQTTFVKDTPIESSVEQSTYGNALVQGVDGDNAEPIQTDDPQNGADLKNSDESQNSSTGTISTTAAPLRASRPVTTGGSLETYSKFETAQGAWKPLWVSRAARSVSARVETSVGPITMRLERGVDGNVTDVVAPEVLRGAIERGLASDANDLLDKDTQYKWRYVREHNEQREKSRQQESGDDNE